MLLTFPGTWGLSESLLPLLLLTLLQGRGLPQLSAHYHPGPELEPILQIRKIRFRKGHSCPKSQKLKRAKVRQ